MIPQAALLAFGVPPVVPITVAAIDSSFTYSGQGAAQAQLYDGSDSTPAADPLGLTSGSYISYDLGSARTPTNLRVKVSNTFGFDGSPTFGVYYSDGSIVGTWVDTGVTFVIPAGTGGIVNVALAAGSHRYWKIAYKSGSGLGGNAWLGEVTYS